MKKYRGIISIAIVASIVFTFAGCSLGGAKFGPSALAKYAKDYGAYLNGDTLFIVFCYGDERDINNYVYDVCEALDVMAPGELE